MPKVCVYLPDELYRQARERGLPLSALAREAIERALHHASLDEWIAHERSRPRRTTHVIDTSHLIQEVRDKFGTDHRRSSTWWSIRRTSTSVNSSAWSTACTWPWRRSVACRW